MCRRSLSQSFLSGFELENLAAANTKGLPVPAAGTFLGGTAFLALGVAGLAALIAPIRTGLPTPALAWTALSPLPLLGRLLLTGQQSERLRCPPWEAHASMSTNSDMCYLLA